MKHMWMPASLSALMLASCAVPAAKVGTTTPTTDKTASSTRLKPGLVAPPQIWKRMALDKQRTIRVSGDHTQFTGTMAKPMEMRAMPTISAASLSRATAGGPVVAGGARIESPMNDAEVDAAISEARAHAPKTGMQHIDRQRRNRRGPRLRRNFDAIGAEDCCVDPVPFGGTVPPDPDIAVGPKHVIVVVNVTFAIYNKRGDELQPPTAFSEFFAGVDPACEPGGPFDPDVVYDEVSGQFIIGVDGNGTDYCIAATTNGDPLGNWNRFAFPANVNGEFFDFPHMGVGVDAVYVGSNQFAPVFDDDGNFLGFSFAGGRVFAVNKRDLLSGNGPLRVVQRLMPRGDGTPQPAQLHGVSTGTYPFYDPHYIMTEVFDGKTHSVYEWRDPFGSDEFRRAGDVDLAAASGVPCENFSCFPVPVPQGGSTVTLAGNDWRGQETEFRNGKLWTTQTISCDPGGGVQNCVRWAAINPVFVTDEANTDGVVDAGVFTADDGNSRWFPSLAVDACNNMAIGYSKSSATEFPSIAATGRVSIDPPGQLRREVDVVSGTESYRSFQNPAAPNRWGDYTGMTIDPDGSRFWYVGEYSGESANPFTNWRTYVAEFSFGCNLVGK